jgi:hypothetical protein
LRALQLVVSMSGHICVVNKSTTIEGYRREPCSSHHHIGWKALNKFYGDGSLCRAGGDRRRATTVNDAEPAYPLEWLIPDKVLRYTLDIPVRGLSSKYGWYLAQELRRGSLVAQVNVIEIKRNG